MTTTGPTASVRAFYPHEVALNKYKEPNQNRSFYFAQLKRLTLTFQVTLICSKRGVPRLTPTTRAEYLEAVAVDGVWIQGYHWMRAVSTIAFVRVGLVIYPFDSVIYFGQGDATIYLYKVRLFF
jgi:hypothetical protein